jgi:serine O-acetyltransferase
VIHSEEDFKNYLAQDIEAMGVKLKKPLVETCNSMAWLTDPIVKWVQLLRKLELVENCPHGYTWLYRLYLRKKFQRESARLGLSIPLNVCGPGLCILHYGSIVISRHASLGSHCTLNSCVNIGVTPHQSKAPQIGNHCYLGPGAKLWGDIVIADYTTIGANACVCKSIKTPGVTVVGTNLVINRNAEP